MSIHDVVSQISRTQACEYAEEYFQDHDAFTGSRCYTGSHFETLGADQNPEDQVTAADLLAVQTLSIKVSSRATIEILGEQSEAITALLQKIPGDCMLKSLPREEFEHHLGDASPANALWDLLRRNGDHGERWGIGSTTASKILARKRPLLIPIQDSVVDKVIKRGKQNAWQLWWEALTADEMLEERAEEVRNHVRRPTLSTLRTLDIVLWMHGRPKNS